MGIGGIPPNEIPGGYDSRVTLDTRQLNKQPTVRQDGSGPDIVPSILSATVYMAIGSSLLTAGET